MTRIIGTILLWAILATVAAEVLLIAGRVLWWQVGPAILRRRAALWPVLHPRRCRHAQLAGQQHALDASDQAFAVLAPGHPARGGGAQ